MDPLSSPFAGTPSSPAASLEPSAALEQATRLSSRARRSTRWYGHYLLGFAAASLVMSVLTGVSGRRGVLVVTVVWAVLIALSSVWVARQQTVIRGMTRLHLTVMLGWTVAWLVTVLVGTTTFSGQLGWWVLGGAAVALSPVLGAVVALRRTA
jgi:hypothetical protein